MELLAKGEQIVRATERAEIEQHDGGRVLRHDRCHVAQRDAACREVEVGILVDQDAQSCRDEVLELPCDYRCHGGHNG